jgi:hypothetical protein
MPDDTNTTQDDRNRSDAGQDADDAVHRDDGEASSIRIQSSGARTFTLGLTFQRLGPAAWPCIICPESCCGPSTGRVM